MDKTSVGLQNFLNDFYPKEQFFKVGLFKLSEDMIVIVLIKKTEARELIYQQILFHENKFYPTMLNHITPEEIETGFEFMNKETVNFKILSFKTENVKEQEEKIMAAFNELRRA